MVLIYHIIILISGRTARRESVTQYTAFLQLGETLALARHTNIEVKKTQTESAKSVSVISLWHSYNKQNKDIRRPLSS